jgi:hypothetical protein
VGSDGQRRSREVQSSQVGATCRIMSFEKKVAGGNGRWLWQNWRTMAEIELDNKFRGGMMSRRWRLHQLEGRMAATSSRRPNLFQIPLHH